MTRLVTALILISCLLGLVWLSGCGAKKVMPETQPEISADTRVIEHVVASGETLPRIADNYYGDPARAADIARDNGLSDQSRLAEGSVLALRFQLDEYAQAQRRAAALGPYNRGVDLMSQNRLAEAGRQFQLALETAPELVSARYNLALVHLRRGMNDEALDQLVTLTELRPEDTDFLFARGNALFQLTRFDEAREQFAAVLRLAPDHSRAAFGLARSFQAEDMVPEARAAWEAYLLLDSTSSWADTARNNLRKLADGQS